jgi:hypothetical protein
MSTAAWMIRRGARLMAASVLMLACGWATPALAHGSWWHISSEVVPANLPPGGHGQLLVVVSNLGDEPIDGATETVSISDRLPAGLAIESISGPIKHSVKVECATTTVQCAFKGVLYPYEQITVVIAVEVKASAQGVLADEASVQGGGAGKSTKTIGVPVGGQPEYGMASFELAPFKEDGTPATQAGEHPFELTTTLVFNQANLPGVGRQPVEQPKDLTFHLPPGLVGDPNSAAQCTMVNFFALVLETNLCSPGSVVGVATVTADEPRVLKVFTKTVPVFNLVPAQGEPARFGLEVAGKIPVVIDTSVRSGRDYGVNVSVKNATQTAGLLSSQVTFWGVPGDPRHDNARGWECVADEVFAKQAGKPCPVSSEFSEEPLLTLPSSCTENPQAEPVVFSMESDSWTHPESYLGAEYAWMSEEGRLLGFEDCGALPFSEPPFTPAIDVAPEQHAAATPTGAAIDVTVPQQTTLEAGKLAEADVRDTTVTLPEGVALSPAAATGLEGCSEAQVGFEGLNQSSQTDEFNTVPLGCPDGSKVGTVRIKTPLLSHELEGGVYLASPAPNGEPGKNPFDSLVALYIVAEDPVSGVLVKLAGEGRVDEGTLQVSTMFKNTPQVPFEELKLHLFNGPRASLSTPVRCGSYATSAIFTPWSGTRPVSVLSAAQDFDVSSGAGGSSCPSGALPFAPGFTAYSRDTRAGAFTGFDLELTRPDGDQALSTVSVHLPSGIAALLSSVELCSESQAVSDSCPAESEVGRAIAFAGLGSEPYVQEGGRVFITGPYENAPFGLEIVTPAQAGPFNLGYVTVRSKLYVNPNDASVTIVSNALPTQIRGIPLQLKKVLVSVDRPDFEFNPTSCAAMQIEGTITGAENAPANVSAPFEVGGCNNLSFAPQLTASAVGQGSKAQGTTFAVTVRSGGMDPGGVAQAGIAKVQLQLPKQLSSRLPTLQKACTDTVFNANPASCGEGSVIGYATIHTPVLRGPLSGPAYLVSHGGAAFPDVEFVLQGEGIELVLDGKTDIKGEVTYSRFDSTPDAPFTTFETVLPAGPHGVLTPSVPESKRFSLCGETLEMPTTMIAQNGARIEQDTKVAVTGCGEVRSAKVGKLTLKQRLERSLRLCRHEYTNAKTRRQRCEHRAHARYTRQALASCRHEHNHAKYKREICERNARKRFAANGARHAGKRKGAKG